MKTIVLAWTDEDGLQKTGRMVQRDLNWFPEIESVRQGKAVIWLNEGTDADVDKAVEFARNCGHDHATVFCYPTSEQEPLARARQDVLKHAEKAKGVTA